VQKEPADVDHIPEFAHSELKIVKCEDSWCLPSLLPDRLQFAVVPRFHFSLMENCGLIIASDGSLARLVRAMH
jgi:hypothetical protein